LDNRSEIVLINVCYFYGLLSLLFAIGTYLLAG